MNTRRRVTGLRAAVIPTLFWLIALFLAIGSYGLTDDHFGRISPARQIARYGALPFRDYLDPGYFLTELSSAGMQRLFGDNLLGELLLNTLFIATGCLVVLLLVRRISGSTWLGVAAGLIAVLAVPRAYDYDKVLFYPLGLLVLWRYCDQPGLRRLLAIAAVIVVAGLWRYDTAVYLGVAALVGVIALHGWTRRALRDGGLLIATTLVLSTPAVAFLQTHGGVADAVDQMLTYGRRESDRTRLTSLPRIDVGRWWTRDAVDTGSRIAIRWAPIVNDERRAEALASAEHRTWSYLIDDASSAHIGRIIADPDVEDTGDIDRQRAVLEHPPSWWAKLTKGMPRLFPDLWSGDNASGILFYVLVALPLVAAAVAVRRSRALARPHLAAVASVITLCILLDAFILRDPIQARVGGMAGPPAVLAAWLVWWLPSSRGWFRIAGGAVAALILGAVLVSLSVVGDWSRTVGPAVSQPSRIVKIVSNAAAIPPSVDELPRGSDEPLVRYVNRCTQPNDRVYANWFFPQLYWFTQRGFGGAVVATFGQHWSEARFQQRMVDALRKERVAIVLINAARDADFRDTYPLVDRYFSEHYHVGGVSNFGDESMPRDAYRLLVPNDRAPVRIDAQWQLPCFV